MKTKHTLQILLLSAVWGISFLLIRIAGTTFPPFWVALLRSGFGALLLWTVLLVGRHSLPPRRVWVSLVLVALFNNAIPFTLFALGERSVPSSTAAILNATTPIWTLLLSLTVHRVHAGLLMIGGVLVGFAGVLLVVYRASETGMGSVSRQAYLQGVVYIVLAALGYGIAATIAKMKLQGLNPIGLATMQLSLAFAMVLPLALAGERPAPLHAGPVTAMLTLGIVGSGLAYLLYYSLLVHISATHVVAVTYLLPVWGLFWGSIAHEAIGWTSYAGVAVVLAGLLMMNYRAFQAARVAAKEPVAATGR